jgi:hypothetical protein
MAFAAVVNDDAPSVPHDEVTHGPATAWREEELEHWHAMLKMSGQLMRGAAEVMQGTLTVLVLVALSKAVQGWIQG